MNGNEKTDCDREKKLLADLDAMDYESWRTMVRWAAPSLAANSNALLAEIIIRRGDLESKKRTDLDADGRLERMSFLFADVGVKLTVVESSQ